MLESDDLKLCGIALFLVLGVLANLFNLGATLWQQQGRTVAVIICFISLGNILLQTSTCVLVASIRAGVLCRPHLPFFFSGVPYIWFISSSVSIWSVAWLNVFCCVKVCRFSWSICRALKENISSILNITMVIMFLTSCVMFTPFFGLHFQDQHVNATEMGACVIRKPLLPAWVDINTYVITFICFLTLMPSTIMMPTSLSLVVYLCRRRAKTQRSSSAESYLLVCRLTVALFGFTSPLCSSSCSTTSMLSSLQGWVQTCSSWACPFIAWLVQHSSPAPTNTWEGSWECCSLEERGQIQWSLMQRGSRSWFVRLSVVGGICNQLFLICNMFTVWRNEWEKQILSVSWW